MIHRRLKVMIGAVNDTLDRYRVIGLQRAEGSISAACREPMFGFGDLENYGNYLWHSTLEYSWKIARYLELSFGYIPCIRITFQEASGGISSEEYVYLCCNKHMNLMSVKGFQHFLDNIT